MVIFLSGVLAYLFGSSISTVSGQDYLLPMVIAAVLIAAIIGIIVAVRLLGTKTDATSTIDPAKG